MARQALDSMRLTDRLRRPEVRYRDLLAEHPALPALADEVVEQIEIEVKYEGYIGRQAAQERRFSRMENVPLPPDADYLHLDGIRIEARQKLDRQRPQSLGQASRIPGVSPGDIAVLTVWLEKRRREAEHDA